MLYNTQLNTYNIRTIHITPITHFYRKDEKFFSHLLFISFEKTEKGPEGPKYQAGRPVEPFIESFQGCK